MIDLEIILGWADYGMNATGPGYIGPGLAGGVIAAIIGIISSFFLAIFGILYYPIKRAVRRRKSKTKK